jgi:DNA polymerase I-like protein with 3'-5' exonuclease and polymerase domains
MKLHVINVIVKIELQGVRLWGEDNIVAAFKNNEDIHKSTEITCT